MKILQKKGGFTKEELQSYKYIVYGNCVTQMKVLVSAAAKLNIPISAVNEVRMSSLIQKIRIVCLTFFFSSLPNFLVSDQC